MTKRRKSREQYDGDFLFETAVRKREACLFGDYVFTFLYASWMRMYSLLLSYLYSTDRISG